MSAAPLAGIRVLDFTWVAAGPRATLVLAQLGAQVIKVESYRRLDLSRGRPPFAEGKSGLNASANWAYGNASKLGITLDMTQEKGRALAMRLVAVSDVVVDNMTAGVMARWGMDYEHLVAVKPDIITLSMPVMGSTGPRRNYGGYGMGIEGISGLKSISGPPDSPPVGTGIAYPDAGPNPRHAAAAVLAALHYRNRTGKGQHIEVAQYESTTAFTGTAILEYTANGRVATRQGNRVPWAAPHGAYRCSGEDRWCVISVENDAQWEAFCGVMGNPDWAKEPRFATLLGRKHDEDELDTLVEAWTRQQTAQAVMDCLQRAGVPAGIVQNGQDLLEHDRHLRERRAFVAVEHPEAGTLEHPVLGFRLSAMADAGLRPAPLLGEHNYLVLGELLGMAEEEVDELIVEQVIY